MVKVSVICVAYNHEKYIRDALDSFISQKTDFEFEVLINDDASTDRTPEIIREYADKYPEIIKPVFQKKNLYSQGLNILETALLSQARGRYFAFIDGDDYWTDPNKLQKQVDILDEHPEYPACVHNTFWHDCTEEAEDHVMYDYPDGRLISFEDAIWGMPYHTSSLMVRREYIDSRPDFYYEAKNDGDDYPQAIWLTMNGNLYYINEVMSVNRSKSTPDSWSTVANKDNYSESRHFETKVRILNLLKNHLEGEQLKITDTVVLNFRYYICELTGQYAQLYSDEFKSIYSSKPVSYKIKLYLKSKLPFLFNIYQTIQK